MRQFADRREAGRFLAGHLEPLRQQQPIILALPRGGVPVAFEVALALSAPMDVLVVRKIGFPGHEEVGIGALVLTSAPHLVMNEDLVARLRPNPSAVQGIIDEELAEARRRQLLYRDGRPPPNLKGKTVILVDDGLATGSTARAALRAIRSEEAATLVLAVPVGAPDSVAALREECDLIVCPLQPEFFGAVGAYYADFTQTEDREVLELLRQAGTPATTSRG